jgi:hypothetical protein
MTGAQIERIRARDRGDVKQSLTDSEYHTFRDILCFLNVGREVNPSYHNFLNFTNFRFCIF